MLDAGMCWNRLEALLVVAVLFPAWFFVQSALSPGPGEAAAGLLYGVSWLMPLLFVALPVLVLLYWKVDIAGALALRMPRARHLLAGVLIGLTAWVPAHELNVLQKSVVGVPQAVIENARTLADALKQAGLRLVSGGTDNHLVLIDLTATDVTGLQAEESLQAAGIVANRNTIPFDTRSPRICSGIASVCPATSPSRR